MDLSFAKKGVDESERAEAQEKLLNGKPLFVEIDEIVSADTIKGVLVLGAFGAPIDTKVYVKQERTQSHIDSLARHIEGSDWFPALRKGDIVCFDRVYLEGGDAYAARITSRTHDAMKGRVQFTIGMARASTTTVSKRGAQQFLTIADGSQAFQVMNDNDIRLAYNNICEMPWAAGVGGFIARTPGGRTFEYHINNENPLQAFIEEVGVQGHFNDGGWLELVPARKFMVGRQQVARDVDVRVEAPKTTGKVGSWYMTPGMRFPGFRRTAVILADENEWAFGGKTGKIHRVAAGIQPLDRSAPVDARLLPSRIRHATPSTVFGVSELYGEAAMDRMAADRDTRRPPEPDAPRQSNPSAFRGNRSSGNSESDYDDYSPTANAMPFTF
jgi:hypothetical protein